MTPFRPLDPAAIVTAGFGRIFLREYAVEASIGIHAAERAGRQRLLIDVDLYTAPPAMAPVDDIGTVVDYDFVRQGITALVEARHFDLQETLAASIVDLALTPSAVVAARVTTAKPDVYPDCAAVGLEVFRAKDAFWEMLGMEAPPSSAPAGNPERSRTQPRSAQDEDNFEFR